MIIQDDLLLDIFSLRLIVSELAGEILYWKGFVAMLLTREGQQVFLFEELYWYN